MKHINTLIFSLLLIALPVGAVINSSVTPLTGTSCTRLVNGSAVGDKNCDGQAPIQQSGTVTANIVATRTTGPAPLAVLFDATGTTHSDSAVDTFRQLGYYFDFDDTGSGTWTHSGLSKNVETGGPLAAHVFDVPGTYVVALRALDSSSNHADALVTITVTDPDTVYSGTSTVCISVATDMTGCPSGAQQITNATSWPVWESNRRYLLRRGDNFGSLGQMFIRDRNDFQVSSYGSGSRPAVTSVFIDMHENNAATPPQNIVIQGLDTDSITQAKMVTNILIYDNEVVGTGSQIVFASANAWYAANQRGASQPGDWKHPGSIFIVENHVNMMGDPSGPLNAIAGLAHHVAIIGNHSEQAKEHTLRIFGTFKSVVGHNLLSGPATDFLRHDFKLMANGINPWPSDNSIFQASTTQYALSNTRYVRIHNNTFGRSGSGVTWHLQVAPQDDGSSGTTEGLRDIVIENNTFVDGQADNGLEHGIQTLGHNIIDRGNTFPGVWSDPIFETAYPSNYSAYSSVYTSFWHGPYHINDSVPTTQAPVRP